MQPGSSVLVGWHVTFANILLSVFLPKMVVILKILLLYYFPSKTKSLSESVNKIHGVVVTEHLLRSDNSFLLTSVDIGALCMQCQWSKWWAGSKDKHISLNAWATWCGCFGVYFALTNRRTSLCQHVWNLMRWPMFGFNKELELFATMLAMYQRNYPSCVVTHAITLA